MNTRRKRAILEGSLVSLKEREKIVALLYLAAALAMVTGLLEIVAAIWIRHVIGLGWPLLLDGIVSMLLGLILVLRPATSASAILWLFGAYVVISCVLLLFFAFRLRGVLIAREKV
jgi:uncharacterized membrane protein HdeD (DUF308 family)